MRQKINCMIRGLKLLISQGEYDGMEREHKLLHETVNAAENKLQIQGLKLLISQGEYESMEREHKLLHETVNAAENKLHDTRTEVVDLTR